MDVSPTETPEQPTVDPLDGEPIITSTGDVNCFLMPVEDAEILMTLSQGEKALIVGITPNKMWLAIKPRQIQKPCWVHAAEVDLSTDVESLEVLPPPVTSTPALGSIAGVVWHETCDYSGGHAGEPLVLGQGCEQYGAESWEWGPNQIYDAFETGWEGVTLHLGIGVCPSTGLATTMTDANGEYIFTGLNAGTYCISYSNLTDGNDAILIPGGPTFPERSDDGFYQTLHLDQGENATGVDFGYAWQFYN
jgi:hypothetical protein